MKVLFPLLFISFLSFGQEANEKYCKKIITNIDKFTNDTTYTTPHGQGFIDPLYYMKIKGEIAVVLKTWGGGC